ncbi:MAG: hypothetical protein V1707_00620 [bacterium]
MKNTIQLLTVAIAVALLITGCGSGSSTETSLPSPIDQPSVINKTPTVPQPSAPPTSDAFSNANLNAPVVPQSSIQPVPPVVTPPPGNANLPGSKLPAVAIKISKSGYVPSMITIERGQSVNITNTDTARHWPASLPYPKFDAGRPLAQNQSYGFVFQEPGVYPIQDKLSDFQATIYVK